MATKRRSTYSFLRSRMHRANCHHRQPCRERTQQKIHTAALRGIHANATGLGFVFWFWKSGASQPESM